jgi:predicted alpha-1,2-mannosidase
LSIKQQPYRNVGPQGCDILARHQQEPHTLRRAIATAVIFFSTAATAAAQLQPVDEVDPTIGNVGILLEPTRPTAYLPNSMIRVYPVRKNALDDEIQYFPLTIVSHRAPDLFAILPGDGTPLTYDKEHATPYGYTSHLGDKNIGIEFAPAHQAGIFRFQYRDGNSVFTVRNLHEGSLRVEGKDAFSGEEQVDGLTAYFYAETNSAMTSQRDGKSLHLSGKTSDLEVRYGVSFISVEQAKKNLRREINHWDLTRTREEARKIWNDALGQIQVEGGSAAQRRVFYTALYRCMERMILITEDGKYYSAYDHKVHEDKRPFYVDNWLWDTFRAMEPLQTLLNPEMQGDKIQSYVRMYEQGGLMPTFALASGPAAIMNGYHAAPWIADAYSKGVRNFDLPVAYQGLRKRALDTTILPWSLGSKTSLDDFYNTHGYMPALHPGEKESVSGVKPGERRQAVAVTYEISTDDASIAQLASILKKTQDREVFLKRATNYRNLFRIDKALAWPKDDKGDWIDIDPKFDGGMGGRDYYDENNGYTYTWDVTHDYDGLINLMGGKQKAVENLDQLFREPLPTNIYTFQGKFPDSTSMIGEFSMANEPSLPIPYIYNRLGQPWKTQKRVRTILNAFFTDTVHGIPGDEDGGGLSSFVVWSMIGLYPVTPGIPVYDIGSPVFTKVTIHLHSGKDIVLAAPNTSRDAKYVQSATWNGTPLTRLWLTHKNLIAGGTLDLKMQDSPNMTLGTKDSELPPASLNTDPTQFE